MKRQLLLLLVSYRSSLQEVEQLKACLAALRPEVGYAVVVNAHQPGEPVEQLAAGADGFLTNADNPGYGRAVNRLAAQLGELPPYIGVLNTDLSWQPGTFEGLLAWLQQHPEVNLAVPQILDPAGTPQKLCKRHPTVLGLFSRRFLPAWLKPAWLKRYDRWYVMADQNYEEVFEAPYLSGCCMLIRSEAFAAPVASMSAISSIWRMPISPAAWPVMADVCTCRWPRWCTTGAVATTATSG
jgi:GT2 family glycosyltransferase